MSAATEIITMTTGAVRGERSGGISTFRGIPYAEPPLGSLRFQPPQPARPWSGVLEATRFGASPPQVATPWAHAAPSLELPGETSEDCLTLNVWSPGCNDTRRPVVVWIFGGGFLMGSSSQRWYDSPTLAREGDVVVVSINYRLGVLGGFTSLRGLSPDTEGWPPNVGLLDQVAALEWVRDNIAAFGGDPDHVTIAGESAGSMSVSALYTMPQAEGLFHRAIMQSAVLAAPYEAPEAEEVGRLVLAELGLTPPDAKKLLEIPADEIVAAQTRVRFSLPSFAFLPFVDGDVLTRRPTDVGAGADDLPVLTGITADEMSLFRPLDPAATDMDDATLHTRVARALEGSDDTRTANADALIAAYREARKRAGEPVDPVDLYYAIDTDRFFFLPMLAFLASREPVTAPTYAYAFGWSPEGSVQGACHSIEVPLLFGRSDLPGMAAFCGADERARRVGDEFRRAWLSFVRHGDPAADGGPAWRAYDAGRRATFVFDDPSGLVDDWRAFARLAWSDVPQAGRLHLDVDPVGLA